jgi:hypothetical protein
MSHGNRPNLTAEEEEALLHLAARKHEAQIAEAEVWERLGQRANMAGRIWSALAGASVVLIGATAYVLQIRADIASNTKVIMQHEVAIKENSNDIWALKLRLTKIEK